MRCLRVRLVTGLPGSLEAKPGRQYGGPAQWSAGDGVWCSPGGTLRKRPQDTKAARSAERRAASLTDAVCASKAQTEFDYAGPRRSVPFWGKRKEDKGGPAPAVTGLRSIG